MMSTLLNRRFSGALISAVLVLGLAGCGNDSPPNEEAQPEPEQPMSHGPMSNEEAGERPSDDL